jgi:formyl-CoA transferase
LDEVFNDPQVVAREMCIDLPHPTAGTVKLVGNPIKMSETPINYAGAPPLLGQHTEQVLESLLQYQPEQIAELKRKGII